MFAAGKRTVTASNITRRYRRVFSSISHDQGGTTPGKLSQKIREDKSGHGAVVEGSGGGYGGPESSGTINEAAVPKAPARSAGERRPPERQGEDAVNEIAEIAKAGVVGAVDVGLRFGEMAKQTMDGIWDVAKRTAEGVRDTVADEKKSRPRGFNK